MHIRRPTRPRHLPRRRILCVADACNHRIARYTLEGALIGYIGSAGSAPGELLYPYDVCLTAHGLLAVCEYGNNRIQLFSADGKSVRCLGRAGRAPGLLAYPWGIAVDEKNRAFVVDGGNNRIQVWQL